MIFFKYLYCVVFVLISNYNILCAKDKDVTDSLFQVFKGNDKTAVKQLFGILNSETSAGLDFQKEKLLKQMLGLAEQNAVYQYYLPDVKGALGRFYFFRGKDDLAFKYVSETEAYCIENKRYETLFFNYYYLASIFYHYEDNKNSLKYGKLAMKYISSLDSTLRATNSVLDVYNIIGLIMRREKRYDEALKILGEALQIAQSGNNEEWEGLLCGNMASIYEIKGDYDKALEGLDADIKISLKHNMYGSAANAKAAKLKIYTVLKKWELADSTADRLINLIEFKIAPEHNRNLLYNSLSFYYETKKDFSNALKFKQLQIDEIQKATEANKTKEINKLKYQFDYEKQEQTILKQDEALKNQRYYFYVGGAIILLLFLLLATGLLFYNRQKRMSLIIRDKNDRLGKQFGVLKKQQEEIAAQNKKLESVMRVKDKIFSIISHDLRAPIGNLQTIFELFEQNDISTEELRELMQEMQPRISGLYETINNLLLWANTQLRGGGNIHAKTVFVAAIIAEIKSLYKDICVRKNIELQSFIGVSISVWCDENQLKVILRNLISNAIKFSKEGSSVDISAKEQGNNIVISIADKGIGMRAEELEKLFKGNFTQKGTQNETGTGLGLLLVKDFVEVNKGSLSVESEKGKGSIFRVTLPKDEQ